MEFALAVPVLFAATVEMGQLFYTRVSMRHLAQRATRFPVLLLLGAIELGRAFDLIHSLASRASRGSELDEVLEVVYPYESLTPFQSFVCWAFTDGFANACRTSVQLPFFGLVDFVLLPAGNSVAAYLYSSINVNGGGTLFPCFFCSGHDGGDVEEEARDLALERAGELREAGVYVYTIGMMDEEAQVMPDTALLSRMANVNGRESAEQPQAKVYFAPTPYDLEEMFTRVASDLMVHLVR